jgi:hypothetical protein
MSPSRTRRKALTDLRKKPSEIHDLFLKGVDLVDNGVRRMGKIQPRTEYLTVFSAIAAKSRNLLYANYTLVLEGLAQESGCLLRVMLEAIELLEYIRLVSQQDKYAV